jgi:dTDP-4-dehydrorhamnose reductase
LRVLIAGAAGMVGRAVLEHCLAEGDEVFAYNHAELDISQAESVESEVERLLPEAIINCAAWTNVDGCELEPDRCEAANAAGPENLARASQSINAAFVTISTDYVFAGDKEGFYTQADEPSPTSIYGKSKLAGELRAQKAYGRSIVVRSGFIFGPGGRNFLSTIAPVLGRGDSVKAIVDAWGTPTYSRHLAVRLRELVQLNAPGVYHVVNAGDGVSYEEFAKAVAEELGKPSSLVQPILSSTLNRPAPRPRNSRLRCLISEARGLAPLPPWHEALSEFLSLPVPASL